MSVCANPNPGVPTRSWPQCRAALTVLAVVVAGCSRSGPELAPVEGIVRLDGRPLAGAMVEFQPTTGSPSYALTDDGGRYELLYTAGKRGALVGTHVVRITTAREVTNDAGNTVRLPERVPEEYNTDSQLTREVVRGGNQFDFDL